jgi:hypothetical protein
MGLAQKLNNEQLDEFEKTLGEDVKTDTQTDAWPVMDERAYQGLAGEIVQTIDPHTESDPVAILGHTFGVFGNMIGRSAHFRVEGDRHYTNENLIIIGDTAKGRKGTAEGVVNALFTLNARYSQDWKAEKVKSGLSSGEGIIYHVRDEADKDEGIKDKRLFVREPEFGGVLRTIERNGNTLSALIRQAWDCGNLSLLTKNNPIKATDAHISIIGHITIQELKKYLYDTEIFNGLANRFMWLLVRRSKLLPEGGMFYETDTSELKSKIEEAVEYGRNVREVKRDDAARKIWIEVYPSLSEGKPGMAGAVLSRAEAHVMRLALLYSLMDLSSLIRAEHLLAALAFWEYVEKSVIYIFGDKTGDSVADKIYDAVCDEPEGLTRTQIFNLFNRHERRQRIDDCIALLARCGRVEIEKSVTDGRPAERVILARAQAQKAQKAQKG